MPTSEVLIKRGLAVSKERHEAKEKARRVESLRAALHKNDKWTKLAFPKEGSRAAQLVDAWTIISSSARIPFTQCSQIILWT